MGTIVTNFLFAGSAASLQTAATQANAALGSTSSSLLLQRARFLAATAAVAGFAGALVGAVKSAIETSAEFQRLGTSFVSILAEPFLAANKGGLNKEDLAVLRTESVRIFTEAQIAAIETVATTREYVQTLQAALAVGQNVGLTQRQTEIVTKRLVLAAGAFGIEQEKVASSIAQILSGSVRVTNQLGRNLGLTTDAARKALKEAIANGTLFDFLNNKTQQFAVTAKEVANNFINVAAAIRDIFQLGGTAAFKPLFDFLNAALVRFRDSFISGGSFTPALQRIITGFNEFFSEITPSLRVLFASVADFFTVIGSQGELASLTFRTIIASLTVIVRLLAEASSLQGTGGLLLTAGLLYAAYSRLAPVVQQIATYFRLIRNEQLGQTVAGGAQVALDTAAARTTAAMTAQAAARARLAAVTATSIGPSYALTTAENQLAAADGRVTVAAEAELAVRLELNLANALAARGAAAASVAAGGLVNPILAVGAAIVGIVALIVALHDANDEATESFNRLQKQIEAFSEAQQAFLDDRDVKGLISEYQQLQEQIKANGKLTDEENQRLIKNRAQLEQLFGANFKTQIESQAAIRTAYKAANDETGGQLEKLEKIEAAFGVISRGIPTTAFLQGAAGTRSYAVALADAKKVLDELAPAFFSTYNPALKDQAKFVEDNRTALENIVDSYRKVHAVNELNTKDTEQLFNRIFDLRKEQEKLNAAKKSDFEVSKLLGVAHGLLLELLLKEVNGNREVAKANVAALIADTERTEAAKRNSLDRIDQLLKEADISTEIVEIVGLLGFESKTGSVEANRELLRQRAELRDSLAKTKSDLAELRSFNAFVQGSTQKTESKTTASTRGTSDRDELKDFLADFQRGFELLKKASDAIEKEANRVVAINRKTIESLAEAGVITFEDAFDRQNQLIDQEYDLQQKLADGQLELLKTAEDVGAKVAARTEDRAKRAKEQVPGKKAGTTRARGGEGFDARNREDELIKLRSDEISVLNKLSEDTRKAEEFRTALIEKQVQARIAVRLQERENIEDAAKNAEETASTVQEALAKVGLLSQDALVRAGIARSQADLDRQREALALRLFPLSDPKLRELLESGLQGVKELKGKLGEEAAGLLEGLKIVGTDPGLLEEFRFDLQQSLTNGGLLDQLLQTQKKRLDELAGAQEKLNVLKVAEQDIIRQQEAGDAVSKVLQDRREAASKAVRDAEAEFARIDSFESKRTARIERLLSVIEKLSLTEEQRLKIKQLQAALAEKTDQTAIKNAEALKDLAQSQLDLQVRLIDFDLQRLDILDQLNEKQRELGIRTGLEASGVSIGLINERLRLLEARRQGLQAQVVSGLEPNSPEAERQRQLDLELRQLGVTIFDLKNRAFDLQSPLIGIRDAFLKIGDAVGNLPEPFNRLKGVFTGLSRLADAIAGKLRPKPEEQLQTASATFDTSTKTFQQAVQEFRAAVEHISLLTATRPRVVGQTGSVVDSAEFTAGAIGLGAEFAAAKKKASDKTKAAIVGVIGAAGETIAGILGAIANKDLGAGIAAFAPLANLIPVAGPFISAGLEIVGSVVSFFAAAAKKKTAEIASTISKGVEDLKHAMSTGALGLGEGIRALQSKLEDARRQLSGRKGGREELAKIEEEIEAEKQRLRDEAKRVQDDFERELNLLRQPASLRDTIQAISEIKRKAQEFIKSFENPADAIAAVEKTQEFIRLSIKELSDGIKKTLSDLQQNLRDATEKFAVDERNILEEGFIDPRVSIAESKRQRLVALERDFQKNKIDLENQISAEQKKLEYVLSREKLEKRIAQLARQGADALGSAADKLTSAANALERAFGAIDGFKFQPSAAASQVTLNFRINGQDAGSTTVGVGASHHIELAGLSSPSRLTRFNPTVS